MHSTLKGIMGHFGRLLRKVNEDMAIMVEECYDGITARTYGSAYFGICIMECGYGSIGHLFGLLSDVLCWTWLVHRRSSPDTR